MSNILDDTGETTLRKAINHFHEEGIYKGVEVRHVLKKLILLEKRQIEEAFNKGAETGLEDEGDIYFLSKYANQK